jgi:HEAT repeat protein
MDGAGVWGWKSAYGTARHTDCVYWSLNLKHGSKRMSSHGCSIGPDERSFNVVFAELTRLRGDASAASRQALELAKQLKENSDWNVRMQTIRTLGHMGSAAGAAASALVDLLDAPISVWQAAPGREPVAVARSVQPLWVRADRAKINRTWDEAIGLYDQVLARDPQNEDAARGRSDAIAARRWHRYVSEHGGRSPEPRSDKNETARKQANFADAAESAIAQIGEPAVPALVHALEGRSPNLRRRAAKTLGEIRERASSAIPALTLGLKDPTLRSVAAYALVRVDRRNAEKYVPVLVKGLDDRDRDVAQLSATALADVGTMAALPGLIHALDDERTHTAAMNGIYQLGPRAAPAIPSIIPALRDGRDGERQRAASTLGAMGATAIKAMPALIDALRNDMNEGVRENAARALGAIGPPAQDAIPALTESLRDPSPRVREAAAHALKTIHRQ